MEKPNNKIEYIKKDELSNLSDEELKKVFILIANLEQNYSSASEQLYKEIIRRENEN